MLRLRHKNGNGDEMGTVTIGLIFQTIFQTNPPMVKTLQRDQTTALDAMWAAYHRAASKESRKALENPTKTPKHRLRVVIWGHHPHFKNRKNGGGFVRLTLAEFTSRLYDMTTTTRQHVFLKTREQASRRLDEWKRRNDKYLKNWDVVEILRSWREKRWSSSTHQ